MVLSYTIPAIPTVYGGRQYRSRLEAKWAAFFDLCGWQAEYEPFDLGEWSPDFLIKGADRDVLVEVKPITALDRDVSHKMIRGATAGNFTGELLLLGTSPIFEHSGYALRPFLGWLGEIIYDSVPTQWGFSHEPCPFAWYTQQPQKIDFCSESMSFHGRLSGFYDGGSWGDAIPDETERVDRIQKAWNRAANVVQWHPR